MRIKFLLEQMSNDDPYIRDNFKRLQDSIESEPLLKSDFKFFEIAVNAASVAKAYPHNLGYLPLDVILTRVSGGATVTFLYDRFTSDNIYFTTSAACTFRCFIGTYREGVLR